MRRVIGSLLLVFVLSSFVFAGTSSSTSAEFNIVEPSEKVVGDSSIVEKSSESDNSVLRGLGVLVLILVIFVIIRKLSSSFGFSGSSSKKKITKKGGVVKKSRRKKK